MPSVTLTSQDAGSVPPVGQTFARRVVGEAPTDSKATCTDCPAVKVPGTRSQPRFVSVVPATRVRKRLTTPPAANCSLAR